ncbi:MAG: outer membrane protein assembly factor BamD [Candidatus Babeliaceae bacterium]|nr:outer membrane protein assembly factor BamD [Candidatus Babeliaceae bacterium]
MSRQIVSCVSVVVVVCLLSGCRPRSPRLPSPAGAVENVGKAPDRKIEKLDFKGAQDAYYYYKAQNNTSSLRKVLERMIQLSTDQQVIRPLLHELADLAYDAGAFEEAVVLYEQYTLMYPGDKDIDYFFFRLVQASERSMPAVERDQTMAKKTLERADAFLARFGDGNRYSSDVRLAREHALLSLISAELGRAAFFLGRYSYTEKKEALLAARSCIKYLNDKLLPRLKNVLGEQEKAAIASVVAPSLFAHSDKSFTNQIAVITKAHDQLASFVAAIIAKEPKLALSHVPW